MRVVALAAVLVLAAVVSAAAARPTASRPITISKGKPVPVKAAIAPGGKVTWRNRDARVHRVRSDEKTWPVFALRPGASKTIRFAERGCYRYSVDGKARGVVAVRALCVVTPPRPVTLRYDIAVVGHVSETRTTSGAAPELNGALTLSLDWRATFPGVALQKLAAGKLLTLSVNPRRGPNGTISGSHAFVDTRPSAACRGSAAIPDVPAFVAGSGQRISSPRVTVLRLATELTLESRQAVTTQIAAAQRAACGGAAKGIPAAPAAGSTVRGLRVSAIAPRLGLAVERTDPQARIWWPLDVLAAGRAFTLDTGAVTGTTECGATTCAAETRLQLTFTPAR